MSSAANLKRIVARATIFGAGPGMGGSSYIEFRPTTESFDVFTGGTAGDTVREKVGSVSADFGWRGRVEFVLTTFQPAHESVAPEEIRVTGAVEVEKSLLALAWSSEEAHFAVRTLLLLSDQELRGLQRAAGLRSSECLEAMQEMDELLDSDESAIVQVLRHIIVGDGLGWADAVRKARALQEAREDAELLLQEEREAIIAPFQSRIDQLVDAFAHFAATRLANGNRMNMVKDRISAFRASLENHVALNGALTGGIIEVRTQSRTMTEAIEVDLRELTQIAVEIQEKSTAGSK